MDAWSNIQISSQDQEIIQINNLEKAIGPLPDGVRRIRELITRFEVCHFKYRRHLRNIRESIADLEPKVDTSRIGMNHIQYGEDVLNRDATGKSLAGFKYIWALRNWLNDGTPNEYPDTYDQQLGQKIRKWLGAKDPDKMRLVRLLLARLTGDWHAYNKLQLGEKYKDIELQACRMDICHYAFPRNLEVLIRGIGRMEAVDESAFEGCGSYNTNINTYLDHEFSDLNDNLRSYRTKDVSGREGLIRLWLTACLAKTIKENIHIPVLVAGIQTP